MILFPNAKINLGLAITEKRPDRFHSLESCFYPVQWCDALEVVPSKKLTFTSTGIEIPGDTECNLCLKAYHAVKADYGISPVHIHLHKHIPIGAGMGGGSSDAAFTVKILNTIFELNLSAEQMENYVRPLGSDCAFFIKNKPVFAFGKGDEFQELNCSLKGFTIVVAYPQIHISTKEAYSGVVPAVSEINIKTLLENDPKLWENKLVNDFEKSLFLRYPKLPELKSYFYENGAVYSSMTGSGSAVYGIFKETPELNQKGHESCIFWQGILE